MDRTVPAKFRESSFNCPLCGVYSMQFFSDLKKVGWEGKLISTNAVVSQCLKCDGELLWWGESIVAPKVTTAPFHHDDMPESVKNVYEEAREIFEVSPRAASALLRLALEKLVQELGYKNGSLDVRIGEMVKHGLSPGIQEALDVVRVIGNHAVHPGQIEINDDRDTGKALFELINYIIERLITEPAKIGKLFDRLPEGARKAIEVRDGAKALPAPEIQGEVN